MTGILTRLITGPWLRTLPVLTGEAQPLDLPAKRVSRQLAADLRDRLVAMPQPDG